ncbi:hypothetical protein EDE08_10429 [Bradyrhizobium sp. R2.2-H]|jgi:hypothetical protein|uniref:beta strand repeat-containing protein n=1 Tax=unclassified Bradyrhizobium TaxID=2631580 RepID=UPI001045A2DB|nr:MULTISPECIES: hypothetical protein [unclassified Bradyrhizobium]TCU73943.1 hypothetical protein EDE10_104613 [Bradyrhizobium sp. Y-H1]TCU75867.1 hypothetical protein EDE08_10429 [Bradyrhizobium sp. R2.2-H]
MSASSFKIGLSALCAFLLAAPAHAQKTKAELSAEVSTTFPDNTAGQITPAGMRAFQNDLINSIMPTAPVVSGNLACFNGTTGLLQDCGTAPDTITIGITNIASGTSSRILYNNAGKVAEYAITGTGDVVMSTGATITSPTFAGTASGAGTLPTTLLSGTLQAANLGTLTGDVTTPGGSYSTSIAANAVTNAKMATMAANTVKGNATGGSAVPTDVAPAAARSSALLNIDSFTGHGDSIYSIAATDRVVGTNAAFTASRTWTLPAANAVNPGQTILVADFQGTVTGSNTLIIARAGSDTINGGTSVTINSANGAYILVSDGSSKWTAQAVGASTATGVSSIDGASGAISAQAGSLGVTGSTLSSNVLSSRTFAETQDLSAFSSVQTLGYATAGDGGGATFQKIAGDFIDTRVLTGTITANGTSGCTNGTHYGVTLDGGSGRGAIAIVGVAGNVVVQVVLGNQSAVGYAAGDLIGTSSGVPGCTGPIQYTIDTVTTPTGSFTDAGGNKWQITFPAAGLDARAMGVKFDWDGTDGTATDNFTTLQNALSFAGYKTATSSDLGGALGGQVLLTKGTAMVGCSGTDALVSPYGVKVKGQGNYSTVIKFCDTFSVGVNQWELCDKYTHLACFGTLLEDFQIFNVVGTNGTSSRSVVYTNNAQHESGMRRMAIYPGGCGRGATYETGYGGATYILLDSVEFKGGKSDANCGGAAGAQVYINYGSTQVIVKNLNVSGYSAGFGGPRAFGMVINGGFVDMVGVHAEQVLQPVQIDIAGGVAGGMVRARSVIGGVDCVGMFTLTGSNTIGNFMISPPMAVNGCTNLVTNNQSGASGNMTAASATDVVFTPNGTAWP